MKETAVFVCRATGLSAWVLEIVYSDGRALLDLDSQAKTWQGAVAMATKRYAGLPVKVSADMYWRRRRGYRAPTVGELRYLYSKAVPSGHFFDRRSMRFFGDTSKNYGVRCAKRSDGSTILELYRRKPVKHGVSTSHYFTTEGKHVGTSID